SGLLVTPTGSGKTLAALGGPLLDALSESRKRAKLSPPRAGDESGPLARHGRADQSNARRAAPGRKGRGGGQPARAEASGPSRVERTRPRSTKTSSVPRTRLLWITPLR